MEWRTPSSPESDEDLGINESDSERSDEDEERYSKAASNW